MHVLRGSVQRGGISGLRGGAWLGGEPTALRLRAAGTSSRGAAASGAAAPAGVLAAVGGAAGGAAACASFQPVEVDKPLTDYRQFRTARLHNNIQVLIVSDAKCDKAAAALSVKVGSLFDPKDIPGLAHFCEHMLFMGTEKYPVEDEYSSFLAKNGGFSNAYTAETVTNYFFGVKPESLDGALDRFAQFFIAPLFTESATSRELQAVDSEHSKNLQQDGWRLSQLLRSSVDPAHPLNHFMTGNSETLRDTPAKLGISVRSALLDFHKRYYSANLMCLVVVGKEDPEELLGMVQTKFSAVLDRNAVVPKDSDIGDGAVAFPLERLGRVVHVVPVSDIRSVTFQFVVPGQRQHWRSKPASYIAHLIGHEGGGSLLAALKQRGLATELSAGSSLEEAGVHIFSVSVMLTEAGAADVGSVGDLLFAYVRLLREAGPDERLWRELQQVSDLGFKFRSLSDSVGTASGLAHSLQEFAPEVALSAGARVWDYEPEQIAHLLSLLRCDRLRLVISGKAHAERCTSSERWYGTRYSDEPLEADLVARWEAARLVPGLSLPRANPFVPQDLELRPPAGPAHAEFPERLRLGSEFSSVATAYFRKDEEFGLPKALCAFIIYCPFAAECLEHRVSVELWCAAVMEELNQFAYEAQMAGLSYSLVATATGIMVRFGGYNDKLPALLSAVARAIAEFGEVPEQTYQITRTVLERDFSNAVTRAPPHVQGFMAESCLLSLTGRSHQERLAALQGPAGQRGSLRGLNRKLLGRCHVECLLQGNLTAPEAQELVHGFLRPLGITEALDAVPPVGSTALPPGWTLLERRGANPEEKNGALVLRLQVAEHSIRSACLTALTSQILAQRFFDELRTKQQLGYIVSMSSYSEKHAFVGLRFIVQSERPPVEVLQRVRDWVEGAWGYLEADLSDEEFREYRASLVAQVQERFKSLGEEFGAHWAEVAARSLHFDLRREQAACLESLGLEDVQRFASEVLRSAPALCVLVASQRGDPEPGAPRAAAESCDRAWSPEDVAAFRERAQWRLRESRIDRHVGGGPDASRL